MSPVRGEAPPSRIPPARHDAPGPEPAPPARRASRIPLAVAALAALARAGYDLLVGARDPEFLTAAGDAVFRAQEGRAILEKGLLLGGTGAYYEPPLPSYAWALLLRVAGDDAMLLLRALDGVLIGLAAWLAARLAARLAGAGRRGASAAWIAGGLVAAWGVFGPWAVEPLDAPLAGVLLLAAAERWTRGGALALAAAGALLGAFALVRPYGVPVLLAAAVGAAVLARAARATPAPGGAAGADGPRPPRDPLRAAALVLVPAALLVLPVAARNTFLERDPVLISWSGGVRLFAGNDPAAFSPRARALAWPRVFRAPQLLGAETGAAHRRFFLRQTRHAFAAAPLAGTARLARKAFVLCAPWLAPVLALGIALLLLRGRGAEPRARPAPALLLGAVTALTAVASFPEPAAFLPAFAPLVPVAAAGLALRPRSNGRGALALATALAVALLGRAAPGAHGEPGEAALLKLRARARAAAGQGRLDEAARLFATYVAAEPDTPRTGNRPDFHLDAPPLQACAALLERADVLALAGRVPEAVADAARVTTDCDTSEELGASARRRLRELAGSAAPER